MKKLTLDEMAASMQVLSDQKHLAQIKGGDPEDPIIISGGSIQNTANGAVFTDDNGNSITLPGVTVVNSQQAYDSAYQLNGTIHLDPDSTWDLHDVMHEYGHYLQQEDMGNVAYYYYVVIPSMYNMMTDPETHDQLKYEMDATERGDAFMEEYYPNYDY